MRNQPNKQPLLAWKVLPAPMAQWASCVCVAAAVFTVSGCQSWPFRHQERTTLTTPGMRISAIQEMGLRSSRADSAETAKTCELLAVQIQTEPDPIVRRTIQNTIAKFDAPLAVQVLQAGLQDQDRDVRLTCCRQLGERGELAAIDSLARIVKADADIDVQLAAVDALGKIDSPASVQALSAALDSSDPAMQYAGVQAIQQVSDQEFGNDVTAWREYVAGLNGPEASAANIAEQPSDTRTY